MASGVSSSCSSTTTMSSSSSISSGQQPSHQEQQQQVSYPDEELSPRRIRMAAGAADEVEYTVGSCSSDVPSLDRSTSISSDVSSNYSYQDESVEPLGGMIPCLKPRLLRQRNSGFNNNINNNEASTPVAQQQQQQQQQLVQPSDTSGDSSADPTSNNNPNFPAVAVDFIPHFLIPQNMGAPIPRGPVRKHSDFEQGVYKAVELEESPYHYNNNNNNTKNLQEVTKTAVPADLGVCRFRRRDEIVLHAMVELNMLWRDLPVIVLGFLFQWFHSIFTNFAYYYQTQLTAVQRLPLKDVAYDFLPLLSGRWWMVSEYMVHSMVAIIVLCSGSIFVIRWNPPHGRPLHFVPILRRTIMTLVVCQVLRCVSFLVTALPGASRQCLYHVPDDITKEELLSGPAPERGNPEAWSPPKTMKEILFMVDATTGCGDLMFSSHTIFTMLFVCLVWRYFNWGFLKWTMVTMQVITVPFILAARKHYTVDVLTALYVVPLVFEVLRMKFPDLDEYSAHMAAHYGIRFRRSYDYEETEAARALQQQPKFVMSMRGGEFYVESADIPLDLQKAYYNEGRQLRYPSCSGDDAVDLDMYEENDGDLGDYAPFIV